MRLSEAQRDFTLCVAKLIAWAYENGYELTFGDAYRDARVHGPHGVKKSYSEADSNHKLRLAVDFNLFIDGEYQTSTEAHKPLGDKWKELGREVGLPLRWGGDFRRPDGNHYECNWTF